METNTGQSLSATNRASEPSQNPKPKVTLNGVSQTKLIARFPSPPAMCWRVMPNPTVIQLKDKHTQTPPVFNPLSWTQSVAHDRALFTAGVTICPCLGDSLSSIFPLLVWNTEGKKKTDPKMKPKAPLNYFPPFFPQNVSS